MQPGLGGITGTVQEVTSEITISWENWTFPTTFLRTLPHQDALKTEVWPSILERCRLLCTPIFEACVHRTDQCLQEDLWSRKPLTWLNPVFFLFIFMAFTNIRWSCQNNDSRQGGQVLEPWARAAYGRGSSLSRIRDWGPQTLESWFWYFSFKVMGLERLVELGLYQCEWVRMLWPFVLRYRTFLPQKHSW